MENDLVRLLERFMAQWPQPVSRGTYEAALVAVQIAKTGKPEVSPARWAEIMGDAGL